MTKITVPGSFAGARVRRLAISAPPGPPHLTDQAERMARDLAPRQARLGDPLPRPWVEHSPAIARVVEPALISGSSCGHHPAALRCALRRA